MSDRLRQSFGLLWRYPAFGRLWTGRTVTLFGDAFALVALPWVVLQTTGSGMATAGILLALQLPAIVSSLAIGSWLDRFQPRAIMAIDNSLRALIVALIPILYWLGMLPLWLLFVLTVLVGMVEPATGVGSRSILPDLATGCSGPRSLRARSSAPSRADRWAGACAWGLHCR